MAVIKRPINGTDMLRIGGAFTAIFSLAMGLLVLYVIPTACSFLGSLQLIILGFLFIAGLLSFFLGYALMRKSRVKK